MPPTATWTHAYVFSWRGSFQAGSVFIVKLSEALGAWLALKHW